MKRLIFTLSALLLVFAFSMTSCSKEDLDSDKSNVKLKDGYELVWNDKVNAYEVISTITLKLKTDPTAPIYSINDGECTISTYNCENDCFLEPKPIDCCDVPGVVDYFTYEDGFYVYHDCH